MTLDTLKLYCDIVRLQSFSLGAKASQITQSAASQSIQQLESQLGVQLIDRSKRPFTMTPEGQSYFNGVRTLLSDYAKLEAELRRPQPLVNGVVRVAAIYSVGLYELNPHIARFKALYPQADAQLECLRPNKVYDAVVNEEAEIGILSYPKSDRRVTAVPWRSEKMVMVAPPNHRLAHNTLIAGADLEGEPFVAFDADLHIRKAIDRALKKQLSRVKVIMEFDNIDSMKQAVETSGAVSILPEPTVRREVENKHLVAIPLVLTDLVRNVGIIYLRQKPLSPAAEKLIGLLKQAEP